MVGRAFRQDDGVPGVQQHHPVGTPARERGNVRTDQGRRGDGPQVGIEIRLHAAEGNGRSVDADATAEGETANSPFGGRALTLLPGKHVNPQRRPCYSLAHV